MLVRNSRNRPGDPIAEAMAAGFSRILQMQPELRVDIKRMVRRGRPRRGPQPQISAPGERGRAVMDFFRLEDRKIVEHRDASQDVPEESANNNTMF